MNQEQNNLNVQNSNAIDNNQNTLQTQNINQQELNQSQNIQSHQQLDSSLKNINTNSSNNNYTAKSVDASKNKNVRNFLIVVAIVGVVFISIGIVLGAKLLNDGNQIKNENDSSNISSVDVVNITGKIKKISSFNGYEEVDVCGRNYFTLKNDDKLIVVDLNGNVVASGNVSYYEPYCYDDGTIMINTNNKEEETKRGNEYSVWRAGKEIYSFKTGFTTVFYEEDILYYGDYNSGEEKAYNLKSGKELWHTKTTGDGPIALENVVITRNVISSRGQVINTILDKKTGEIIATGSENSDVLASYSNYFITTYRKPGTEWLEYLEVYDYDSNLISKLEIDASDKCGFGYILSNGYYLIDCNSDASVPGYSIYDYNSNLIRKSIKTHFSKKERYVKNNKNFASINILDNANISVVESDSYSEPSLVVYNNGNVINYFTYSTSWDYFFGVGNTGYWSDTEQRTFLFGVDETNKNIVLTNFLTGEQKIIGENKISLSSKIPHLELWGGKYFVIREDNIYSFYDEKLNKLEFETDKSIFSIADEWIVLSKYDAKDQSYKNRYYITNILSKEEFEITSDINMNNDINGIKVNRNGIIAKNGETYYLYQFQ